MKKIVALLLIVFGLISSNTYAEVISDQVVDIDYIKVDEDDKKKPKEKSESNNKDLAFVETNELTDEELKEILEELDKNDESHYFTEQLINVAKDYEGVKYKYGGTSRNGVDCSGFVLSAFKEFDITLPRTSINMASVGEKIKSTEAQKGDLIFFKGRKHSRIGHVGIITDVDGDEIKFIHASSTKGVVISSLKEAYYKNRFVQINRVYEKQYL